MPRYRPIDEQDPNAMFAFPSPISSAQDVPPAQNYPTQQQNTQQDAEQALALPDLKMPSGGGSKGSGQMNAGINPPAPPRGMPPATGYTPPPMAGGVDYYGMPGFAPDKLNDPSHRTAKYDAARFMQTLANPSMSPNAGDLQKLNEYMQGLGYDTAYSGQGDQLMYNGAPIDVVRNFGGAPGTSGWSWEQAGGQGGATGGDMNYAGGTPNFDERTGQYTNGGEQNSMQPVGGLNPAGGNVGNDYLSQILNSGYANLIQGNGQTPFGNDMQATLSELIKGSFAPNQGDLMKRFESARELENKAMRTQMNDTRGMLADRGLLSEPGTPQGSEVGSLRRINESIAPEFARAARDAYLTESQMGQTRGIEALRLGTGMAQSQADNILNALQGGTQRQAVLSDIAIRTLSENRQWNQFIAQLGLDRDKLMYEIQRGNIDSIAPIIELFIQLTQQANQGYH